MAPRLARSAETLLIAASMVVIAAVAEDAVVRSSPVVVVLPATPKLAASISPIERVNVWPSFAPIWKVRALEVSTVTVAVGAASAKAVAASVASSADDV